MKFKSNLSIISEQIIEHMMKNLIKASEIKMLQINLNNLKYPDDLLRYTYGEIADAISTDFNVVKKELFKIYMPSLNNIRNNANISEYNKKLLIDEFTSRVEKNIKKLHQEYKFRSEILKIEKSNVFFNLV